MTKLFPVYLFTLGMFILQSPNSNDVVAKPVPQEWVLPEIPDALHAELCHKDYIRFWRLRIDTASGAWHLYNKEDDKFLKEIHMGINSGRYRYTALEWFALPGKLPAQKGEVK